MDNLHLAMSNWMTLGMQAGFRISEWAQTNSPPTIADNFKRNVDGTSTAFRTDDLIFFSKGKKKINTIKSLVQLKNNKLVNLRWRFQKNQDNDQQLTYSSDKRPDLWFVKTAVDIRRRVARAKLDDFSPIAVFLQHDTIQKEYKFITDKHIQTLLQEAAAVAYSLKVIEDLQKKYCSFHTSQLLCRPPYPKQRHFFYSFPSTLAFRRL